MDRRHVYRPAGGVRHRDQHRDGRGRALNNVFIEWLWPTVNYEEVYLKEYDDGWDAEASVTRYFCFYCHERTHQSLGYRTAAEVYEIRS